MTTPQTFKARPTTYKGAKMRSRLEAGFAAWLDEWRFYWEYEPQAFGGSRGQYLPDFRLTNVRCSWLELPAEVFVEVKRAKWHEDSVDAFEKLFRSMATIWESLPDAVLLLASPERTEDLAEVGLLDLSASPVDRDPFPWSVTCCWAQCPNDTLGLARPISEPHGPWPHEYWRVK